MKPDQKYMPAFRKSDDGDIQFTPFKITNQSNNQQENPSIGWIPVFFYNNQPSSNTMNGISNTTPLGTQITLPNIANSMMQTPNINKNIAPINTISPGMNKSNTNTSNSNYNPELSPSETQSDTLYSYNKQGTQNNGNINSNTNLNNTPNTNQSPSNISKYSNQSEFARNTKNENLIPNELIKNICLNLDEDIDLIRNCPNNDIDKIYHDIEKNNSGIISLLQTYDIPIPIVKLIIRKIIKISLNYCKEK